MKRTISLIICLCMLASLNFIVHSDTWSVPTLDGYIYTVSTADELRWIAGVTNGDVKKGTENYPSDSTFLGYTIFLKNDVSVGNLIKNDGEFSLTSGTEWIPIGTEENPFSGTFDGNGCGVGGIYVSNAERMYNGFFGFIDGGTVKNLTVEGYVCGSNFTGGLAGKLNGEINGCIFVGDIKGELKTGGIAGEVCGTSDLPSKIHLSAFVGNINAQEGSSVGGIAGFGEYLEISSSYSKVSLYSFCENSGGILGAASNGVSISSTECSGFMTADGQISVAGGILGFASFDAAVTNCSFSGDIYCGGESKSLCGGIAGDFAGNIVNCFVMGSVHSGLYFSENETDDEKICVSAGIVSSSEGAEVKNCYFSGMSECHGLEGDKIAPYDSGVSMENVFYSLGTSYILCGTENAYHVMAMFDFLDEWTSSNDGEFSKWLIVSGINETKPVLKHKSAISGDGTYFWKVEGNVFTYFAKGKMEDFSQNKYGIIDTPWAAYRDSIRTVTIKEGVVRIGNNAFNSFDNLRYLNLPSSLTEIGDYAFEQCVYLKNFTFPSGLSDIGEGAFRKCKTLTSVSLPNGIRAIRKYTFSSCEKLSEINIPSTVSFIGYMAFALCDGIVSVVLPQSVREIDSYSFYYCDNLTTVDLPVHLTRIGEFAFGRCELLINYTIPTSTTVEANAFWSEYPKGDIDGDGKYTVFDYLKIKAHFLGVNPLTNAEIKLGDCDFDGIITATDYLMVKKYLFGIKES